MTGAAATAVVMVGVRSGRSRGEESVSREVGRHGSRRRGRGAGRLEVQRGLAPARWWMLENGSAQKRATVRAGENSLAGVLFGHRRGFTV